MSVFDPQIIAAFLTLSALEIVLAIDNLIFLSVVTDRLPPAQAQRARVVGLAGALVLRLALLASIVWPNLNSNPPICGGADRPSCCNSAISGLGFCHWRKV